MSKNFYNLADIINNYPIVFTPNVAGSNGQK